MIVNRSEDFLRRYENGRHLPYCHLEVHLGELEQPNMGPSAELLHQVSSWVFGFFAAWFSALSLTSLCRSRQPYGIILPVVRLCRVPSTHLLKNCGIRSPSDRPPNVFPPYLGVPLFCRGIEMWGFIWQRRIAGSGACPPRGLPCRRVKISLNDCRIGRLLAKAQDPSLMCRQKYGEIAVRSD